MSQEVERPVVVRISADPRDWPGVPADEVRVFAYRLAVEAHRRWPTNVAWFELTIGDPPIGCLTRFENEVAIWVEQARLSVRLDPIEWQENGDALASRHNFQPW